VDLLTAKRTLVAQNNDGFGGFQLDNEMAVRFAVKKLPDGSTQVLTPATRSADTKWNPFETIAFEDADTTSLVAFAPGNKAVYMNDSRGRDTAALVSLDLATKKQTVIAEDPKADSADVIIHPTKHTLQAVAFNYLKTSWKVLDPSIQKDLDNLAKLDGGEVRVASRTLDDKIWAVATTSEQHPVHYYLWDRAKQKGTLLFA